MDLRERVTNEIELSKKAHITLKKPMTIEELLTLMTERWDTQKHGNFKLSKFLFVKSIKLDGCMMMKFEVYITGIVGQGKNILVDITRLETDKKAYSKTQNEQIKAAGGYVAARKLALDYHAGLCDAMRDVLREHKIE
jgi:microcompartment protein CcmK/EutM